MLSCCHEASLILLWHSVVDPEPLPTGHDLYKLENVVLTPHMSGLSSRNFVRGIELLNQNISRLENGAGVLNAFRGKGEE